MGGIVPVVNIDGVAPGDLVLDGPTLADIFLGTVKSWDDPAIRKLNPNAKLPSQAIAVVHRSDGSGTTFNWTYYLAEASADWKSKVGSATSVEWAVGIGAKGNEGVSNNVSQTKGSIGYVEYAYALQNKLVYTKMLNKDGKTVAPDQRRFPGRGRQRRLEFSTGLRRDPRQSGRGRVVADDGRDLHPHSQAAGGCERRLPKRSSFLPGPTSKATRWRKSSITCRCRRKSSPISKKSGPTRSRTQREAALHRGRDGALSSFDANSAGPAAVAQRPARALVVNRLVA